jgi:hypothetical protein
MKDKSKQCNGTLIFRRFRTDKRTGKVLDAYKYGLRAWPICIQGLVVKEKAIPAGTA